MRGDSPSQFWSRIVSPSLVLVTVRSVSTHIASTSRVDCIRVLSFPCSVTDPYPSTQLRVSTVRRATTDPHGPTHNTVTSHAPSCFARTARNDRTAHLDTRCHCTGLFLTTVCTPSLQGKSCRVDYPCPVNSTCVAVTDHYAPNLITSERLTAPSRYRARHLRVTCQDDPVQNKTGLSDSPVLDESTPSSPQLGDSSVLHGACSTKRQSMPHQSGPELSSPLRRPILEQSSSLLHDTPLHDSTGPNRMTIHAGTVPFPSA